jgi:integrase
MVKPRGKSFQADVTIRGVRYRKDFPTQAQAEKYEADARALPPSSMPAKRRSNLTAPDGVPTLEWLLRYVHATRWKGKPAERSVIGNARQCLEILGPTRLASEVDEQAVEALVKVLWDRKYSGSSINMKLAPLGLMLRVAYEHLWIDHLPNVERRHRRVHQFRTLSEAEEGRLLGWCRNSCKNDLHALVLLLVDTGATLTEVLKLKWEDVTAALRVRGKPERTIPLTQRLSETLANRRGTAAGFEKVFSRGTRKRAEGWWGDARSALGLDGDAEFTLACLRDTYCDRQLRRGEWPAKVSELTGVPIRRLLTMHSVALQEQRGQSGAVPPVSAARTSNSRRGQAWRKRMLAERAAGRIPSSLVTPQDDDGPRLAPVRVSKDVQVTAASPVKPTAEPAGQELTAVLTAWMRLPADVRSGIAGFVRVISEA